MDWSRFPTETVYGLGARGLHVDDVRKIFTAKGRPPGHPVILHVDGEAMARGLASEWSPVASELARRFWPGPLTLVVPRAAHVPAEVSGGLETVGIRAPAHPVALALIRAVGEPLAAPSANVHTLVSPTKAEHVAGPLFHGLLELILDGGPCDVGIESTVVAVGEPLRVLRPGANQPRAASRGRSECDRRNQRSFTVTRRAPRREWRHGITRPAFETRLIPRGDVSAFPDLLGEAGQQPAPGHFNVAMIVVTDPIREAAESWRFLLKALIVMPDDPQLYARGLYAALRDADKAAGDLIVIEAPPADDPAWAAVSDRLKRATQR